MGRRTLFVLAVLLCVSWPPGATAKQGMRDDPRDSPRGTTPDVRRLYHEDNASEVIFWMESYTNFAADQGPSCTWRLEWGGDTNPELLVLHGASARGDQQITYRNNEKDTFKYLKSHARYPGSETSTSRNTIRVPVSKKEMTSRGFKADARSYRYQADCGFSGATTGNDYVPDNRTPSITHALGVDATPQPATPAPTPTPTPTPKPTAKATKKPAAQTTKPTATPTPLAVDETADDDDDLNMPLAIAAIIAVLLGIGFVFAFWRRRRDEEDSAQRA